MTKLIKYLKPFVGLVVLAIVLLFVQAMADLSLPDYMSNIVNVGIQQGGIESAVPEAIRQDKMDKLLLFVEENKKDTVLNNYTLVTKSKSDYENYLEDYPILSEKPIYVLKEIDEGTFDQLNQIIGKALLTVSGIEKIKAEAENGVIEFNGRKIPASMDLFSLMANLPNEQRLEIGRKISEKFTVLGEGMVVQGAASEIRKEYKALGMNMDKIQNRYILKTGGIMLLISLVSAISIVLVGYLASKTAAGLARNLRGDVFSKVEGFAKAELDKFSTASLITRTTNDITQIQMLTVIMIRMIFYAPIMGAGGVIKALGKSQSMSWIIAVAVMALLGLISIVFALAMPKFKAMQKLIDKINLVTREQLSGIMVIRAFNTQEFEENRFDKVNKKLTDTSLFINRVMVTMFPSMMLIMNGVTLLIVWVGAHQIANSSMQVGDMMAFMQYAIQILTAFLMMSFVFIMIPRASVAGRRVAEVLETDSVIVDPETPKTFDNSSNGYVEFKDVSFRYPGAEEDVLRNISFKAKAGQTTAIIGSTGSGKSTLINLIPRFYDVSNGGVVVDGIDVRDVSQHDLRDKIGYVPQKSSLFSGTIESNLKYAKQDASLGEVKKAAEIAQAMEFIEEKPEGIEADIAQGGNNVSGGQKQRLSIARAIMKKPDIYIFDDSFSALDFKTESALRRELSANTQSSIVFLVAQRIASIMNADQIIVLDEGRMVGIGTHQELMKNCATYQEIAHSQLSKEELA